MGWKQNYLIICVFLYLICTASLISIPNGYLISPCPRIFQYKFDEAGILYGLIQTQCPDATVIELDVEMTVGNVVKNYNGHIELVYPKEKVIDDIIQKRPIFYKLFFPFWNIIPPKITKISVNGVLLCQGPPIPMSLVPVLTTITLKNRLTLNTVNLGPWTTLATTPKQELSKIPDGIRNPYHFNPKSTINPTKINDYDANPSSRELFSSYSHKTKDVMKNNNIEIINSEGTKLNFDEAFFHPGKPTSPNVTPGHNSIVPSIQSNIAQTNTFSQPFPDICGLPLITNPLIVHGADVPKGAYPWLVALFGAELTGLEFRCSGSLITSKHVVTAAHCVQDESRRLRPDEVIAVLGRLNIQRWISSDGSIMMEVSDIAVHEEYKPQSSHADIAVITLKESIHFTQYIRPVCLWSGPEDLELVTGVNGTVVGWGKNQEGLRNTRVPYSVVLPIVSQEMCLRSAVQFRYITSDRTFCAGEQNGIGPCNGDSGSGFIIRRNGRWMLRGVVSMAISDPTKGTCDLSNYIVFSDASKFRSWILGIIK